MQNSCLGYGINQIGLIYYFNSISTINSSTSGILWLACPNLSWPHGLATMQEIAILAHKVCPNGTSSINMTI